MPRKEIVKSVDAHGAEVSISYTEIRKGRYDIFDSKGNPLYQWANERKLQDFKDAVKAGRRGLLDNLRRPTPGPDGQTTDTIRRYRERDPRMTESGVGGIETFV